LPHRNVYERAITIENNKKIGYTVLIFKIGCLATRYGFWGGLEIKGLRRLLFMITPIIVELHLLEWDFTDYT